MEVRGPRDTILILDAGTGLRRLADSLPADLPRFDILLTHLHLDHLQGLGFFAPLFDSEAEVHLWGPRGVTLDLHSRLTRYLSPPLFPVHLRSLPARMVLHEMPGDGEIGELQISARYVCHPGPTLGYRIEDGQGSLAYLPDHEPALGVPRFPAAADWTSGYELAADVDLLIHDAQYTDAEYATHVGWGHSSIGQALAFATLARVGHLVLFHHDPQRSDEELDQLLVEELAKGPRPFPVTLASEEAEFSLPPGAGLAVHQGKAPA